MADRCFVAVEINDVSVKDALIKAQGILRATGANVKCVEEENIHITLKFLGEIPESQTVKVSDVVKGIAFRPLTLRFEGVGVFPSLSRPSVVWAGVEGDLAEMLTVFTELEDGLRGLGFEPERRPFHPHVTLCRVRSGRNRTQLAESIKSMQDELFGSMQMKHICLKRSILTKSGPIYSNIAHSQSLE